MLRRSGLDASLTVGHKKLTNKNHNSNYDYSNSQEDEKRFYEEQKALLNEEIDEFEDEEFETELPRRISEAVKALNERMKGLK